MNLLIENLEVIEEYLAAESIINKKGFTVFVNKLIGSLKKIHPHLSEIIAYAQSEKVKSNYELIFNKPLQELEKIINSFQKSLINEIKQEEGSNYPYFEPKKYVTRMAPNPNTPPTIMNFKSLQIHKYLQENYADAEVYLRFDDTDPVTKPPSVEGYTSYICACDWYGLKLKDIVYASDRFQEYYRYLKLLADKNLIKAEVDENVLTKNESIKELINKAIAGQLPERSVVFRFKSPQNIEKSDKDWALARIKKENLKHPRVNYSLWPTLHFQSAIDDHLMGINLIIRGRDLEDSARKQKQLYLAMGWTYPEEYYWGRSKLLLPDSKEMIVKSSRQEPPFDKLTQFNYASLVKLNVPVEVIRAFWKETGFTNRVTNLQISYFYKQLIRYTKFESVFHEKLEKLEIKYLLTDSLTQIEDYFQKPNRAGYFRTKLHFYYQEITDEGINTYLIK